MAGIVWVVDKSQYLDDELEYQVHEQKKLQEERQKAYQDWEKERLKIEEEQRKTWAEFYNESSPVQLSFEVQEALKILELPPTLDFQLIKTKYRTLMKKYHPDRYQDEQLKIWAEQRTKEINNAYEFLDNCRQ